MEAAIPAMKMQVMAPAAYGAHGYLPGSADWRTPPAPHVRNNRTYRHLSAHLSIGCAPVGSSSSCPRSILRPLNGRAGRPAEKDASGRTQGDLWMSLGSL